jgi:threonine/homoserine/homoserine lactone efflux protein
MPDVAAFVPIALLLVITPGATTAIVVRHALDGGHRAGVAAAVGAALGNSTHAAAAAGGLALLLQRVPSIASALNVAGAGLLAWLGLRSLARAWRASGWTTTATASRGRSSGLADGLAVTLLNPATLTFYLAVVPGFVRPPGGFAAFALLAVIHVTMAFSCHLVWALAFDRLRTGLARPAVRQAIDAGAGLALVLFAARMVWHR